MKLSENTIKKYGIFTMNKDFANEIITSCIKNHNYKPIKRIKSELENRALMENGMEYIWIKPLENARGHKMSGGVIDLATCSLEFIRDWIPALLYIR